MAWETPKTNWTKDDYFNAKDYNRICNNLKYLKEEFTDYFGNITYETMVEKMVGASPRASEYSALPHNLYRLNNASFKLIDITNKTYQGNTIMPNYTEWNRVENYILLMYNTFYFGYIDNIPRLPFILGDRKPFGKLVYVRREPRAHRLQFKLGTKNGGSI